MQKSFNKLLGRNFENELLSKFRHDKKYWQYLYSYYAQPLTLAFSKIIPPSIAGTYIDTIIQSIFKGIADDPVLTSFEKINRYVLEQLRSTNLEFYRGYTSKQAQLILAYSLMLDHIFTEIESLPPIERMRFKWYMVGTHGDGLKPSPENFVAEVNSLLKSEEKIRSELHEKCKPALPLFDELLKGRVTL